MGRITGSGATYRFHVGKLKNLYWLGSKVSAQKRASLKVFRPRRSCSYVAENPIRFPFALSVFFCDRLDMIVRTELMNVSLTLIPF